MKKILAVILALTMVLALAACGAAPTTAEPAPEAPDPLKSEMPSKIYEESAAANPEGKTVNILLVIDMQKDFVDQALGTAEAQAIVPNVVAKINEYKERGDVIIATKDTHEESYLETQEGVNLPFIHCVQDTEGWQLDDAVQAAMPENATIVNKPTFGSTDLVERSTASRTSMWRSSVFAPTYALSPTPCSKRRSIPKCPSRSTPPAAQASLPPSTTPPLRP